MERSGTENTIPLQALHRNVFNSVEFQRWTRDKHARRWTTLLLHSTRTRGTRWEPNPCEGLLNRCTFRRSTKTETGVRLADRRPSTCLDGPSFLKLENYAAAISRPD